MALTPSFDLFPKKKDWTYIPPPAIVQIPVVTPMPTVKYIPPAPLILDPPKKPAYDFSLHQCERQQQVLEEVQREDERRRAMLRAYAWQEYYWNPTRPRPI